MQRKLDIPLIVPPELWMVLLTRFISRSDNDYKSFINFINIKGARDEVINNKEFFVIVKAIEDITDDLQQQESIIDALVEEKFSYLEKELNEDITPEQVYDKTKEKAEKMLSTQINTLTDEVHILSDQIQQLNEDKILQANLYNKEYKEEIKKERENTAQVYAKEKLSHKRILNAIIISIMLFINRNLKNITSIYAICNRRNISNVTN